MIRKITTKLALLALILLGLETQAQTTFTQTSVNDTLKTEPDTLRWNIVNLDTVAITDGKLTVFYDGDFGASSEIMSIYGENNVFIGNTVPNAGGMDCMLDSVTLIISSAYINSWSADDTIKIIGVTSMDVNLFCTNNHARIRLSYDYCPNPGGPTASISISNNSFCPTDAPAAIVASPSGGTLSGTGISGNSFDPSIGSGTYTLTYTYTSGTGCTSMDDVTVKVNQAIMASIASDTICEGETSTFSANGPGKIVWFSDSGLTNPLDTGTSYTTSALSTSTSFFVSSTIMGNYFVTDTFRTTSSAIVDHDTFAGDDRGGIAVTMNHIYIGGDDSIARYDLNLQNGITLTRNTDAFFSDLSNGQLYTLYNPIIGMPNSDLNTNFYITQIRSLNADMTLDTEIITLSDSISFGYNSTSYDQSGIFAGQSVVVVYSSPEQKWFSISLNDGLVTELLSMSAPNFYVSENWSVWGVAELNASGYSVLYRSNMGSTIDRRNLADGTSAVASYFTDLSDMASFTYAPWNSRWYFHYEGTGEFGGLSETLGYAQANDSTGGNMTITLLCHDVVNVNVIDLSPVISGANTICAGEMTTLTATSTGNSYTWSPAATLGSPMQPVTTAMPTSTTTYTVTVTDNNGCIDSANTTVVVNPLPAAPVISISGNTLQSTTASSYQWSLDGNVISGATSQTFNVVTNGSYTVTITDANGCSSTSQPFVTSVGMNENTTASFRMYPNPASNKVVVEVTSSELSEVVILDVAGEVVIKKQMDAAKAEINISELSAGFYFVRLVSENGASTKMLTITK